MTGEKRERHLEPRVRDGRPASPPPANGSLGPHDDRSRRAARSNCTILITGETGVGKGFLAKWIHGESRRAMRPFVPVNCGAIPESIVDSQLFGHVRGAFSGAITDQIGLVRAAEHGTLFLDEVGELPPSAQTRLLRLLHDREIQPVGHPRPVEVDVRILAASNGDLEEAVEQKRFREDLLFRLDIVRLHVRALRERADEIPILVDAFNREFAALYGQAELVIDRSVMDLLLSHHWPGNIRQLRTVIERLHVLCPGEPVTCDRLRDVGQLRPAEPREPGPISIDRIRREELMRILDSTDGSIARTASIFGVHRSTIYRWLQRYAASVPQSEPR